MSIKYVSLETGKALNKCGFNKECDFTWEFGPSAPTSDEILEELPKQIVNKDGMAQWLKITPIGNDWMVVYDPVDDGTTPNFIWCGQTKPLLCEALAEMWLYLKKEGLL